MAEESAWPAVDAPSARGKPLNPAISPDYTHAAVMRLLPIWQVSALLAGFYRYTGLAKYPSVILNGTRMR
jgi:hypothetical protein